MLIQALRVSFLIYQGVIMTAQMSENLNKSSGPVPEFKNRINMPVSDSDSSAMDKIEERFDNVLNTTRDSIKQSQKYVKDNPLKGIAYSAAAGAFIGSLVTLFLRRKRNA